MNAKHIQIENHIGIHDLVCVATCVLQDLQLLAVVLQGAHAVAASAAPGATPFARIQHATHDPCEHVLSMIRLPAEA